MINFSLKYRLKEKLGELTHREYIAAIKSLPRGLGISQRTFFRYLNVRVFETFSIPSDVLIKLGKYFECQAEDLLNFSMPPLRLKGIKRKKKISIKQKFRLVK